MFSEILKGIDQRVVAKAMAYRTAFGRYTISVITVMEIVKGFHKLQREDRLEQFLAGLPTVELLPMIAALALRYTVSLVTGNTSHYQRIQALGYPLQLDNRRL